MGFPNFHNGSLLFCNGGLAASCCNGDGSGGGWNDSGGDAPEPVNPCDPPTDWDGAWAISTPCSNGDCDAGRTELTIEISEGEECRYKDAVITDALCGKVKITIVPPITGGGEWTVWAGGGHFTSTVSVTAGVAVELEMNVPDAYKDVIFQTAGCWEFKSRIKLTDGTNREWVHDSFVYIHAYDWENYGDRYPSPCIHPFMNLYNCALANDSGKYTMNIIKLKGPYETYGRAVEVWDANSAAIVAYVNSCACPNNCGDGEVGSTGASISDHTYEGPVESSDSGAPPYISAGCPGTLGWGVEMIGTGYSIYLQKKPYGSSVWTNIAGGSSPGNYSYNGQANPCDSFRAWGIFDSASGEYVVSWEYSPYGDPPEDCTTAVQEAFDDVPNY